MTTALKKWSPSLLAGGTHIKAGQVDTVAITKHSSVIGVLVAAVIGRQRKNTPL